MPELGHNPAASAAHLVRRQGPYSGTRYDLRAPVTRVGRARGNDIVLAGPDAVVVSGTHAEICSLPSGWRIRDLASTNGTFVDGRLVREAELRPGAVIRFGSGGPELVLLEGTAGGARDGEIDRTVVAAGSQETPQPAGLASTHERRLRQAIVRARVARRAGALNQTAGIMREVLASVVRHSRRNLKAVVGVLSALLLVTAGLATWRIHGLEQSRISIDARIEQLEKQLAAAPEAQTDALAAEIGRYDAQGRALRGDPLFRLGAGMRDDYLTAEIRTLLQEFGAEVYSIPPDFRAATERHIRQYQGPDRPNMSRALVEAQPAMDRIRRVLAQNELPPDFAYMVLVESALNGDQRSRAGSAGLWQFTPPTARALGLRVDGRVDERLNATKSTRAACKYIRDLILDFGSGSSVMLALAAYNLGPAKVKQAIRRVADPIQQRNFWYLYRTRALPRETREYVPKVIAAMIVGRDPSRFGF